MARIVNRMEVRRDLSSEVRRIVSLLLDSGLPLDLCLMVLDNSKDIIKAVRTISIKDYFQDVGDSDSN